MADPRQSELLDPMTCDAMDLLLEHSAALPPEGRWPPMLRQLVDVMASYNERMLRWSPKQSADDAIERVVLIADYLGGRNLYLPRGDVLRAAARDAVIYRLSDRLPKDEIGRMWGLSELHVYKIVATQKSMEVDRLQGKLFDDATGGNADPSRPVGAQ